MLKRIAYLLLLSNICFAQQNLKENYKPLKSSGLLPDVFTQNIRSVISEDISVLNHNEDKDKSLRRNYLTAANYEIAKIVKSGNTLVNDEVSVYLNKIADIILKDNPTLRKELHIYALKSAVVNAYSYDKGYIFIDIGLISQLESEAQLAYVLCHEISHYTKKHNINSYVQNHKIENNNYNGKDNEDRLIEKCQYSKEKESEADLEGFKLFEATKYDFLQAEKAFDVLQYAHLPFELVEFNKAFFETEHYKIPNRYLLKEFSSIRNNSSEDDSKQTHPNTAKRKQAIANLVASRNNADKVDYLIGKTEFQYIRDIARMELCRLYLKNRDYPNALYAGYILAEKYPDNQYLAEVISKCLYALTLLNNSEISYDKDSYLEDGIPSYKEIESYPQQIYYLIKKMPSNEWTMMSLNYVYRKHKKFPENKRLESYSDSLFKFLSHSKWGIVDFVRLQKREATADAIRDSLAAQKIASTSKTEMIANIQKENNFKNYDTAYYKEMFLDLFISDTEFVGKFPTHSSIDKDAENTSSNFEIRKTSRSKRKIAKAPIPINTNPTTDKVLLLESFYLKIDKSQVDEAVQYITSDEKQKELKLIIDRCAAKQNFKLVTLDPDLISAQEVDKMNDYSIVSDWLAEKYDCSDCARQTIFCTNDIDQIIDKYQTRYILKFGIINYKPKKGKRQTYYYSFAFDLKTNELVYKKSEYFKHRDSFDFLNGKVYQTLYELKHQK
ncbi:MAG: M48 family metallopeptidase [Bacteroidetes bacterium]|nr:M48 family metallopeptidase [Bacteroidota bacterium]